MTTTVRLAPNQDRRVRGGHCWVFSNELATDVASLPPGGAVTVEDARGRYLGTGYANPNSLIAVRLLTRDPADDIDSVAFYQRRIQAAAALRAAVLPQRRSYRMVAAEADFLPGLIIDRYNTVAAVQIGTLGLEVRKELLRAALEATGLLQGAVLRDQNSARRLEGLPIGEPSVWFGEVPLHSPFEENGVKLLADLRHGQKTGFFFDQADNRAAAFAMARGRVLDVYANTGAWGIGALLHGADEAVAIEINANTCALIAENAAYNGVAARHQVLQGDAWEQMTALRAQHQRFDAVYLDPPAFAKSRKTAGVALRAYRDHNGLAMQLVKPGGLLFTSSCSHHIDEQRFFEEILDAAGRAQRGLRLLRRGGQAPDHPILPAVPETRYLKHFAFVVDGGRP